MFFRMLLELYLFYSILAFGCFFTAIYYNNGINNIFIWPIALILFAMLVMAPYNIVYNGVSYVENGLSWFNVAMVFLTILLMSYDLYDKFVGGW